MKGLLSANRACGNVERGPVAKRSPILGYNHNVRHRGLLFHIQTEDSGIDNPHIYTHLFHGGIILASRKLEYDRGLAEDAVRSLMQAQHKASLRQLKAGSFDTKISTYLGDQPELQPSRAQARASHDTLETIPPAPSLPYVPAPPAPPPLLPIGSREAVMAARAAEQDEPGMPTEPSRTSRSSDVSNAFRAIKRETTAPDAEKPPPAVEVPQAAGRRRLGSQTGYSQHHTGQLELLPDRHDQSNTPAPRGKGKTPAVVSPLAPRPPAGAPRPAGNPNAPPAPPLRAAGKARAPSEAGPQRPGVVVSRPAVIVGAPPPRVVAPRQGEPPPGPRPAARRPPREDNRPSLFGKDLISERSLDEVILAYLSEDASDK